MLTASRDEHSDLFRAFPNSYGTLGYSVRIKIELEPVKPFVAIRHLRFNSLTDLFATMDRIIETGGHDGTPVDYLDGVVFSADESYLALGMQTADARSGQRLHRPGHLLPLDPASRDGEKHDRLTIHDYLWRWDTDWFWCSRAFGAQNPTIRRFWPRRYRRSSFYWKLIGYDQRFNIADRIEKRNGRPPLERVVQDIEVPIGRAAEFVDWFLANVPDRADLVVPVAAPRRRHGWPLYPIAPHHTYVNIGFWSSVPAAAEEGHTNKLIERKVSELDGHKSLYSDAYYTPDEFDELYGGETYKTAKEDLRSRFASA